MNAETRGLYEVVSIGLAVPTQGIRHAGGEYVRRHHIALRLRTLMVVEPTPTNHAALAEVDPPWVEALSPAYPSGFRRILWGVLAFMLRPFPFLPRPHFVWTTLRDRSVRRSLAGARVLEVQWTQFFIFARLLPIRKEVRKIAVSHDVMSQATERRVATWRPWQRSLLGALLTGITRRAERYLTNLFDDVIVFSEKDRDLLRELGVTAQIHVVPPGLENEGMPVVPHREGVLAHRVVIVGHYARSENVEGAMWFLNHVWPEVQAAVPTATLALVGADAPEVLTRAANAASGVELTGYVADIDSYYRSAAVVAVPVLRGAGVKFKTVTAMLWGVPIVSTSCGIEGVAPSDLFHGVADEPGPFAKAVVGALIGERTVSQESLDFARARFGNASFEAVIRPIFGLSVSDARESPR